MVAARVVILLTALLVAWDARAAGPAPAELPPPDFTARQYIDSKGCVFLRDGEAWVARQARDGTMLCGYPPTLSARRRAPDQADGLFPQQGKGTRAQQIEQVLTEALITNLKPGELASDPRPVAKLPDMGPEPASAGPIAELRAEMAAKPAISAKMGGGLRPNQELCNLLGYNGGKMAKGKEEGQGLGQDPSGGFCADLPRSDLARLAFARPVPVTSAPRIGGEDDAALVAGGGQATASAAKAAPKRDAAKPPAPRRAASARQPEQSPRQQAGQSRPRAETAPATAPTSGPAPDSSLAELARLVPAGARYVHVGAYADRANAERAIARLKPSGLPILRSTGKGRGAGLDLVMLGPFGSRQAVVIALDKARKAGFRDAFAR